MSRVYNVLFLCTGNSARSIMAEAILNHVGRGRFAGFSAGSRPAGTVNPFALEYLGSIGLPAAGARSKRWDEFAAPGAPRMDFILTVCDDAAGEECPTWPGKPATAHWGVADPARIDGSDDEKRAAFRSAASILRRRIELLTALPDEKLAAMSIKTNLRAIGKQR